MERLLKTPFSLGITFCMLIGLAACSPSGEEQAAGESGQDDAGFSQGQLQQLATVAVRISQQAALRDVKRLEHRLAQMVSAGRWQEAAELFSSDARLLVGEESYSGKAAIGAWFRQQSGALPGQGLPSGRLYETFVLSPVLNLAGDGTRASGRWRQIRMLGDFGEAAEWQIGISENEYVEEDGEWRIARLHHYPLFGGNYDEGWRNLKEEIQEDVAPVPFHYDVDSAGIPAPAVDETATIAAIAEPEQFMIELENRARALHDEDQVINLVNAYGYYLDRKMWDDITDMFSDDGTLEFGDAGVYQGKSEIRQSLEQFGDAMLPVDEVFDHVHLQPVATIAADGRSAYVRGTKIHFLGVHGESSELAVAVHETTLVKQDDTWMLDGIKVMTRMLTDYEQGWADNAQAAPVAQAGFEASGPATGQSSPYPAIDLPTLNSARTLASGESRPVPAGDIDARLAELDRLARVLDAYVGSVNVANAYGYSIDEFLWDDMADLFSVDGWKELSYIGRYIGRERVRQSVVDRYGRGGRRANSMTFHQKTQPVVTVAEDGRSAEIRTRLFQLNSSRNGPGSYMSGIYEDATVLEDGIWKLSAMDLDYQWYADYPGGWEHTNPGNFDRYVPEPGSLSGSAAPDGPLRGIITPPYPDEPVDMAFHYRNPVSGREPPILLDH